MTMHDDWTDPVPFDDADARNVPPLPLAALPATIRNYAESIAGHVLTPVDLPGTALLTTISAACAGRVRIHVGQGWYEPANLYALAVLPPSTHKSPVVKRALEPVEREESDLQERWAKAEQARALDRAEVTNELGHLKRRKPTPEGNEKMRELGEKLASLAPTPRPSLLSDDATSEALVLKLAQGPVFVAAAEGRPFELMSGLYRKAGEDGADVYLKAWSEDPLRVSRVQRGDVFVARPLLTMFLAVQPVVVAKLAAREDFRGRGLIARFLCTYPKTRTGYRDWATTSPLDGAASLAYAHRVAELLSMTRPEPPAPTPLVEMSPEARALFLPYRNELEASLRSGALLSEWQDLGGKLAGHCARIALVLHMAERGAQGPAHPLSGGTMARAIDVTRYFVAHTVATWEGCAVQPLGEKVVRWLAKRGEAEVTARDLIRGVRGIGKASAARDLAVELVERGYLRPAEDGRSWAVHPCLWKSSEGVDSVDRGHPDGTRAEEKRGAKRRRSSVDNVPTTSTEATGGGVDGVDDCRPEPVDSSSEGNPATSAELSTVSTFPEGDDGTHAFSDLLGDPPAATGTDGGEWWRS